MKESSRNRVSPSFPPIHKSPSRSSNRVRTTLLSAPVEGTANRSPAGRGDAVVGAWAWAVVAVAVFHHGMHQIRRQSGVRVEAFQLAVGGALDQPQTAGDPEIVMAVGHQGQHHVGAQTGIVQQRRDLAIGQSQNAERERGGRVRKIESATAKIVLLSRTTAHNWKIKGASR